MKYIDRDENGNIRSLNAASQYKGQEKIAEDDSEVVAYLNPPDPVPGPSMADVIKAVKALANGDDSAAKALK